MRCRISSELQTAILCAAAESPAREVCGLLLGEGLDVAEIELCENVAADPSRFFEIDPARLFAAYRRARGGGLAVIGHYHSHPAGPARPSLRDADAAADDGALWLIAGGGTLTAWRAVRDGTLHDRFDPVAIDDASPCADSAGPPQGPDVRRVTTTRGTA